MAASNRVQAVELIWKLKVSVYDCDTMIVSGTSYYLWVMDYYKVNPFSFIAVI